MKDYSLTDLEQVMKESDHRMEMIYRKAERQAEEYKKVIYPPSAWDNIKLFIGDGKLFGDPASLDSLMKELKDFRSKRIKMDRTHRSDALAMMTFSGMPIVKTNHMRGVAMDVMA